MIQLEAKGTPAFVGNRMGNPSVITSAVCYIIRNLSRISLHHA